MNSQKNNLEEVLDMTLEVLGFTAYNGGQALCVLVYKDWASLQHLAFCPSISKEDVELASLGFANIRSKKLKCGNKIRECKKVIQNLRKLTAKEVLVKWSKYNNQHPKGCKQTNCAVRCYLVEPMHKLLKALTEQGFSESQIILNIPEAKNILGLSI